MVQFSFSAVLICLITANLLIILCTCILKSKRILVYIGYPVLGGILLLIVIRLLFPYEFPFTKTFWLPDCFSKPISFILHPIIHIANYTLSIWHVFILFWIVGSCLSLIYYLYLYFLSAKKIKKYECTETSASIALYKKIISQICQELKKNNKFHIVLSPDDQIPMYFYCGKPYIVLPQNIIFSKDDLYFILRHEMSHHFHHDMVVKYFVIFLCIIYWWNPCTHLLKKQCNTVLEMHVDKSLTKNDPQLTVSYLNCLINTAKRIYTNRQDHVMTIPLYTSQPATMIQRFRLLLGDRPTKKRYVLYIVSIFIITSIFISSFFYNFNASYVPNDFKKEKYVIPNSNNMYAIVNDNNTYDIYLYGKYLETTDTLDFYQNNIPIYTKGD